MSLSYTEDVLDALENYTEANLGTRLSAITADQGDGMALPDLNDVLVGVTSLEGYHNWPLGFIIPVSDNWEMLTMEGWELTVEADFWIVSAGYAEDTLYRQMLRYAAGLWAMIDAEPDLGDQVGDCAIQTVEYYPRVAGVDGARAARLRLVLTQEV
jgi:hypothetical protein